MHEEIVKSLRFYEETGCGVISPSEAGLIADALEDLVVISDELYQTRLEVEDMRQERNYWRDAYYEQLRILREYEKNIACSIYANENV